MDKKKSDKSAATTKTKPSGKSEKERFSVLDDKGEIQGCSKPSSYTDDLDFPPSDKEGEGEREGVYDEKQGHTDARRDHKSEKKQFDISFTDRQLKKLEKKEKLALQPAKDTNTKALEEDRDAFTVVIASKTSVLKGEDTAHANVKDISIHHFSVSISGKQLLKNVSLTISHGKKYGLVGPNGMGKSTLLKLLAWRKIPALN